VNKNSKQLAVISAKDAISGGCSCRITSGRPGTLRYMAPEVLASESDTYDTNGTHFSPTSGELESFFL
jgi:hypothetical protein